MENENNQNEAVQEQTIKTKKSKLPIIIIAILLLLVAVFAGLYFFTDLFKSETQVFTEKLTSRQSVIKQIEESKDLLERMEKESYKSETKITLDLGNELEYIAESNVGIDLSKLEIAVNTLSDTKNTESSLTAKYDSKEIITLDMISKDSLIGLRIKDLYSKYLTVENSNLKSLFEKFGVTDTSSIPDRLLTSEELSKAITITEKDADRIEKKYSKVISESVKSEEIKEDKDVTLELDVNGETKKLNTKKSTITLNEKEALELVLNLVKEAKDDEDTLKLIEDNYNNIVKLYEDAGYDMEATELSASDMKDSLKDLQEELETELEDYKDKSDSDLEKMDIVLYEYKDEIIKTAISIEDMEIAFTCYAEDEDSYMDLSMKDSSYSEPEEIKIYTYGKTKEDGKKITSDGVIGVKYNSELDVKIKFTQTIDFGADVSITDLSSSNSLNINNATTSELENVLTEVQTNIQTYAMKLYMNFPEEIEKISELMGANSTTEIEEEDDLYTSSTLNSTGLTDSYMMNSLYSDDLLNKVETATEEYENNVQETEQKLIELESELDSYYTLYNVSNQSNLN